MDGAHHRRRIWKKKRRDTPLLPALMRMFLLFLLFPFLLSRKYHAFHTRPADWLLVYSGFFLSFFSLRGSVVSYRIVWYGMVCSIKHNRSAHSRGGGYTMGTQVVTVYTTAVFFVVWLVQPIILREMDMSHLGPNWLLKRYLRAGIRIQTDGQTDR